MPQVNAIDPARRLIVTRLWGDLTSAVILAQRGELTREPRFDPTFRHIVFVDVDRASISMNEIRRLAEASIFSRRSRRAFVARSDLAFGLMQMFDAYGYLRGFEIGLFRTDDEAAAFLGLQADFVMGMRLQLARVDPPAEEPAVVKAPPVDAMGPAGSAAPVPAIHDVAPPLVVRTVGDADGASLDASLVPRRGIRVERWRGASEDSRLRLVSPLEVRFLEPAPPDWDAMPPERLARLWDRAEPA